MKLCMIGNRGHNGYVWQGLSITPEVRVVGVSVGTAEDDVTPLLAQCEQLGHSPQTFTDYRDMLDQLQPDIVSVCGPFEQHASMSMTAFERGIHVFCEKPVALTLEDLAALKSAYAQAKTRAPNLHFAAMMGLRYAPAFYTAWRAVQEGAVGAVRLLNTRKSYKLGRRDDYYHHRETYGGTIPWVGAHAMDWIYWFSGQAFVSVYATHSAQYNRDHGDLEVAALCHFTLANQIFASASIDYLRPLAAPTHGDDRVRVMGTEGAIEVAGGQVVLINAEGVQNLAPACDRQIFRDFVLCVKDHRSPLLDADDVFAVTEACLLARQSADADQVMTF